MLKKSQWGKTIISGNTKYVRFIRYFYENPKLVAIDFPFSVEGVVCWGFFVVDFFFFNLCGLKHFCAGVYIFIICHKCNDSCTYHIHIPVFHSWAIRN